MVNKLPDAPSLRKVCPHISYSDATVFCKGNICHTANPQRFQDEGFCFILIPDGQGELPETGDNDQ